LCMKEGKLLIEPTLKYFWVYTSHKIYQVDKAKIALTL
jgi:hypothetical protein